MSIHGQEVWRNHSILSSDNVEAAKNATYPSICTIHMFIYVYFCSVSEGLCALECYCCVFIRGGSVWGMGQQVLQMWLWKRRIPEWVSLHQDRFLDGARSGLHARYLLFRPRRLIWKPIWRNGNESSLLSVTQIITIDEKLNSIHGLTVRVRLW